MIRIYKTSKGTGPYSMRDFGMSHPLGICLLCAVLLWTSACAMKCYTCSGASSNDECNQQGLVECPESENWCQTEIRTRVSNGNEKPMMTIRKGCKQSTACLNNVAQNNKTSWPSTQCNHDLDSPLSVCRYCCSDSEGCNEGLTDHDCGEIIPPRNAEYDCEPDNRYFSSQCSLKCRPGFRKTQPTPPVEKTCSKNGSWSMTKEDPGADVQDFSCVWDGTNEVGYPYCPLPVAPKNSNLNCTLSKCFDVDCDVGTECELTCDKGFQHKNRSKIICTQTDVLTDASWNISPSSLDCVSTFAATECSKLTVPKWGGMNCTGSGISDMCNIYCLDGFYYNGSSSRQCQEDGTWSGLPGVCENVTCPEIRFPQNGFVNCYKYQSFFGIEHFCIVECEYGYEAMGPVLYSCLPDGTWSASNTTCEAIKCPELDNPLYGVVTCNDLIGPNAVGSECTTTCNEGAYLYGDQVIGCQDYGFWNGSSTCNIYECPQLTSPQNGILECVGPFGPFSYLATCDIICDSGYTLVGSSSKRCLNNGSWSKGEFKCIAVVCPQLSAPSYGSLSCSEEKSNFSSGSVCNVSCQHGATLVGSKQRYCQGDGSWGGERPSCEIVQCPALTAPVNGSTNCNGPFGAKSYDAFCDVSCEQGFELVGSIKRSCLSDGSWSGDAGFCREWQCNDIGNVTNGYVFCDKGLSFSSTCTFECEKQFQLVGDSVIQCLANRSWSHVKPYCSEITCVGLQSPRNGIMECILLGEDFVTNSTCQFACDQGYKLVGSTATFCLETGMWSNQEPFCEPVVCPQLPTPLYGSITCTGRYGSYAYGTACNVSCNLGTNLLGSESRYCRENGSWSGVKSSCEIERCPELTAPLNGIMDCAGGQFGNRSYDTVCNFTCNADFELIGSRARSCLSNRSWSGDEGICKKITCESLAELRYGYYECDLNRTIQGNYFVGSVCKPKCESGYLALNGTDRICQNTSMWSGYSGVCQQTTCVDLQSPRNGIMDCILLDKDFTVNSSCHFACDSGYRLIGPSATFCLDSGLWSNPNPFCERIVCPSLVPPNNGKMSCVGNIEFGVSLGCIFTCESSYVLNGSNYLTCTDNGTWSKPTPTCKRGVCSVPDVPTHGSISCDNDVNYNSTCTYKCDAGYEIIGSNTNTCDLTGIWINSPPSCSSITCAALQAPTHGLMECDFLDVAFDVNSTCRFSCDFGYLLNGTATSVCMHTGMWSKDKPSCTPVTCPALTLPTGAAVYCDDEFRLNSTCTFTCDEGYVKNGSETLNCVENGYWNGTAPTCQRVECLALENPQHGTVSCDNKTSNLYTNTSCYYSCNEGYFLRNHDTNVCENNGSWTHVTPSCSQNCTWHWTVWGNCTHRNIKQRKAVLVYPNNNCPVPALVEEQDCCESKFLVDSDLGICYKFHCDELDWQNAVDSCLSQNGNLIKITSFKQHNFLRAFMRQSGLGAHWIGLTDKDRESEFKWSDGSILGSYQQWFLRIQGNHQPDNYRNEDCVKMTPGWKTIGYNTSDYDWNDSDCNSKGQYICQIPCNGEIR